MQIWEASTLTSYTAGVQVKKRVCSRSEPHGIAACRGEEEERSEEGQRGRRKTGDNVLWKPREENVKWCCRVRYEEDMEMTGEEPALEYSKLNATCNIGISFECQLESYLLHFRSSFRLVCLRKH